MFLFLLGEGQLFRLLPSLSCLLMPFLFDINNLNYKSTFLLFSAYVFGSPIFKSFIFQGYVAFQFVSLFCSLVLYKDKSKHLRGRTFRRLRVHQKRYTSTITCMRLKKNSEASIRHQRYLCNARTTVMYIWFMVRQS